METNSANTPEDTLLETRRRRDALRLRLAFEAGYLTSVEWDIKRDEVRRFISTTSALPIIPEDKPITFREACENIYHKDRANFIANVQAALKHEQGHYTNEFRIIDPETGEFLWLSATGLVEFDSEGQPAYLIGFSRDITAQKKVELNLRESEHRYAGIVESAMDAIISIDRHQRIILFNAAAEKMFGCRADEVMGEPLNRFIPQRFHQHHQQYVDNFARSGTATRKMGSLGVITGRRVNGEEFLLEASISQVGGDGGPCFTAVLRDISERKKTEDRLRESKNDLDRAQAVGQIGSWRINLRTSEVIWSAENHRIFGVPEGSALSFELFINLVHPDDREYVNSKWQAGLTGEPYDIEHRIVINGEVKWVRERAYLETDESDQLLGAFGITQDITQRKLAELALHEASHRKDEFLAMLAHELRNPLAPISNAVKILRMTQQGNRAIEQTTDMISRQVKHLVRLVDDLLDVSRVSRGKIKLQMEPVNLAGIIRQAIETSQPLIDSRGHTLKVCLPPGVVRVEGDATRLAQVISNLLNNAAKYTDAGGTITLGLELQLDNSPDSALLAVIRVKDNGRGMEPAALENLFNIFYQADRNLDRADGGLGIGLYLVKSLVTMHGGQVQAFSEGRGKGSEFVIHLPYFQEPQPEEAVNAGSKAKPAHRKRILLVDDNPDVADSMAMLLNLFGHDVIMAHDGREAVDIALKEKPDIVLLDIGLPGMNGYEACRAMRNGGLIQTMIVALTGYGQEEDRKMALKTGFDHHLAKPVDLDVLEKLLVTSQGV